MNIIRARLYHFPFRSISRANYFGDARRVLRILPQKCATINVAMKRAVNFIATNLVPEVPADWVHIVIVDVFAAPVGAFHSTSAVFSIVGLDNIGDKIQCEETFVLFHVLLSKFKKCMNSAQAKRVMILSHKALAGQPSTTHLQQENAPNLDSGRMIEI